MLTGLHLERPQCGGCVNLPSHVLKASSKAITSDQDGDPFRMVLMKLHEAAGGPNRRKICRRFVTTRDESAGSAGAEIGRAHV